MSRGRGRLVTRPSIPSIVWLAAGLWLGVTLGEAVSWGMVAGPGAPGGARAALLAVLGLTAIVKLLGGRRIIALLMAAGVVTGALLAHTYVGWWSQAVARVGEEAPVRVRGVVVADAREGEYGARVTILPAGTELPRARISVFLSRGDMPPEIGQVIEVDGRVEPVDVNGERARDDMRRAQIGSVRPWKISIVGWRPGVMGAVLRWRHAAGRRLAMLDGAGSALLTGIVLGDRRRVRGSDVEQDFRVAGLSHLLAVSGLHLGLVSLLAAWLARRARLPPAWQAVTCLGCGALFAATTGFQPSTVRALLMVGAAWGSTVLGRRGDPLASLAVAAMAVIAHRPMAAFDISLRLSVAAVGGLLVFGDLAAAWLRTFLPRCAAVVASGLAATTVAQASILPIASGIFHAFSVVAPLANVVVLPLASAALGIGLVGTVAWGWLPFAGEPLTRCACLLLELCARLAALFAAVPGAAVAVDGATPWKVGLFLFAAVLLWSFWPLPRGRRQATIVVSVCVAALVFYGLGLPGFGGSRLVVMDVGQADAILVRDGGETMLVDCASHPGDLLAALGRQGIRRLDVVVLTHAHDDHIGGMDGLVGVVRVGWVGHPVTDEPEDFCGSLRTAARLAPRGRVGWRTLQRGDRWMIGGVVVTVLWPDGPAPGRETNDTSVVLLLEKGDWSAVLTGDAESAALEGIASLETLGDVDVVKAPHHGSENGLTPEALAGWTPEVVLVSVGEGNPFGHPSEEVLDLLAQEGVATYRTDIRGDLTVGPLGTDYAVRVSHAP